MIKATRHLLRRLGLVSVLLMMLATVLPSAEAQACAPMGDPTVSAFMIVDADGCDTGQCNDCGATCTHGCCHAPHVAIPAVSLATPDREAVEASQPIGETALLVARTPDGPDRPPRV